EPGIGQVDAVDLDLGGLLVKQRIELFLGELADGFVWIEKAALTKDAAIPAVHAVAGDRERTLVERFGGVVELRQIEVRHRAPALAARTHAANDRERLLDRLLLTLLDRSDRRHRWHVESVGLGRADVRLAEP